MNCNTFVGLDVHKETIGVHAQNGGTKIFHFMLLSAGMPKTRPTDCF